ncbi:MAG: glycosyltransferase family 4 protein [Candidatus Bathyarchaeia archaeon]
MRLAFFVWEYPPMLVGGLGTYAENITRKFVELNHDVTVFTLNPGGLPTREVIRGVEVHRPMIANASNIFPLLVAEDLKRWGTNIKFFNDLFIYNILSATKFVNDLIRKEHYSFDLASIHDWLSCIAGLIAKNEINMPLAFHVHSTEWGRSGNTGSQVVTHLEHEAAEKADRIVTVSYAMREDLVHHGWAEPKISVVWNGVDPEVYDPARCSPEEVKAVRRRYGVEDDEAMVFFIGRLTWVKGVRYLLQAMPLILRDFPKTKLVILGRGEEQRDLQELCARLGVEKNVSLRFEFIPERERILHYAASDVCVFPSLYEPFGIVSLEAMSMEKPLVVGARGVVGFREQVVPTGPDQNGIHINGGDPVDIAWGIKGVLSDPVRAKQWGVNGRKRVLEYFTWDKVAQQTLQVYENALTRTGPAEKA